jgi:hypothetical protein
VRSGRQPGASPAGWRPAILGILAVSLSTVGCSADAGAGDSRIGSAPPAAAPVPAPGAATAETPTSSTRTGGTASGEPTNGPAVATALATLEEALRSAFDGGQPSTEQEVRGALVAAGFAPADVQVTAGRTPTGLAADAVEVGVHQGGECLVAQIRAGAVSVTVLPVLADGRCLVGAPGP